MTLAAAKVGEQHVRAWRVSQPFRSGGWVPEPRQLQHAVQGQMSHQVKLLTLQKLLHPRRRHRACNRRGLGQTVNLATLNVQRCSWSAWASRPQLASMVTQARAHQWGVMFLTDFCTPDFLDSSCVHFVGLEEFTLVCRGRVGLLLSRAMLAAWQLAGSVTKSEADCDRWLSLSAKVRGVVHVFTVGYAPTQVHDRERQDFSVSVAFSCADGARRVCTPWEETSIATSAGTQRRRSGLAAML